MNRMHTFGLRLGVGLTVGLFALALQAGAATVTVSDWDSGNDGAYATSDNVGTLTNQVTAGALDTDPVVVYTFSLTNANLGGTVGDDDDTMTWTITLAASLAPFGQAGGLSSPVVHTAGPDGQFGVKSAGDTGDNLINAGEVLEFIAGPVTYTIDGGVTNTGSFVGFTTAMTHRHKTGGSAWTLDGGLTTSTAAGTGDVDLHGAKALRAEWLSGQVGTRNQRCRLYDIDFQVSTNAPITDIVVDTLTAADISTASATLGATIQSGAGITNYGIGWHLPGDVTTNMHVIVDSPTIPPPKVYSGTVTGLVVGTVYNFLGWASNAAEGVVWSTNESSFLTEPIQASGVALTSLTDTSMTVSWTTNAGCDGSLVLVRQGPAPTGVPEDDTTYATNARYGSLGTELGDAYVVFSGTGASVEVTGLTTNTTYHAAVFGYAADGALMNYQQDDPPTGARYADYITITEFQAETSDEPWGEFSTVADNGTVAISGVKLPTASAPTSSVTWTFILTNATLDDVGFANDSMTWDMTMTGEREDGGNCDIRANVVVDVPVSTAHWIMGPGDALRIDYKNGERLTFTPGEVTYSLNGGPSGTGSFRGFVRGSVLNWGGAGGPFTTAVIGGETVSGSDAVTFSTKPDVLVVDSMPGGRFRFGNVVFEVSTPGDVPPKPEGMVLMVR